MLLSTSSILSILIHVVAALCFVILPSVVARNWSADQQDAEPIILFSKGVQVVAVHTHSRNTTLLFSSYRKILTLDYYYSRDDKEKPIIFFSDAYGSEIFKASPVDKVIGKWNFKAIIESGLGFVNSLTVDWINKKLYWIDSKHKLIGVSSLNGKERASVVSTVYHPTYVKVDPIERLLFWTEKSKSHHYIKRSHLNGQNKSIVVDILTLNSRPTPFFLNLEHKSLYWVNEDSFIESSHYNGSFCQNPLKLDVERQVTSILDFNNTVYWSSGSTLLSTQVRNNSTETISLDDETSDIHHISIYHQLSQPLSLKHNPCDLMNGGCTHICSPSPDGMAECGCPYGLTLQANFKHCQDVDETVLIIDEENHMLITVSADDPTRNVYPPSSLPKVSGKMIMDVYNNNLFWTTENLGELRMIDSLHQAKTLLSWGNMKPTAISIDKSSGNIYIASLNSETRHKVFSAAISVCSSSGLSFMNVISSGIHHPKLLKVHPSDGQMYVLDMNEEIMFIKSSRMDGSDMTVFYKTSAVITAMEVDQKTGRVYWAEESLIEGSMQSVIKFRARFSHVIEHHSSKSRVEALVATSFNILMFQKHKDFYSITKFPVSNEDTNIWNRKLAHNVSLAIKNVSATNSVCDAKKCDALCIPQSSNEYVCPPVTGISNFLFFTKHSHLLSMMGFSILPNGFSGAPAFPLGLSASWVTHSAYYYATDSIFWVDSISESIKSGRRDNMHVKTLKENVKDVGGLTVDWIAGNLYWSETARSVINVMRIDGRHSNILIYSELHNPTEVAVDPNAGFLYWVETENGISSIKRSTLSGKDALQLIGDLGPVSALKVDPFTSIIYWSSSESNDLQLIESDGSGHKIIKLAKLQFSPSSFTFDEEYIYWTDVKYQAGSVIRIQKSKLHHNHTRILQEDEQADDSSPVSNDGIEVLAYNLGKSLTSIHYFSSSNQRGQNPCTKNNGGCEQLCLFEGNDTVSCHCSYSVLAADNKTCTGYSNYLVYPHGSKMYSLNPDEIDDPNPPTQPYSVISNDSTKHSPTNLIYNSDFGGFMFIDSLHKSSIYFLQNNTVGKLAGIGRGIIHGISYSNTLRTLVWTQTLPSALGYIQYDTKHKVWTKSVHAIRLNNQDPSYIVIDDCAKTLFWVDSEKGSYKIHKMSLDSQEVKPFISSKLVISSLSIDNFNRLLYWTESDASGHHNMNILRHHLDLQETVVIYSGSGFEPHMLLHAQGCLYWSDWFTNSIVKYDIESTNISFVKENVRKVRGLAKVSRSVPSNCTAYTLKVMGQMKVVDHPENNSSRVGTKNGERAKRKPQGSTRSSLDFDLLLISLPGIMLATIFFSLLIILFVRKYTCCHSKKVRVSYLSYSESLPRGLCCSAQNMYTDPTDQQAPCVYHMEMECVNLPFDKINHDEELLLEP